MSERWERELEKVDLLDPPEHLQGRIGHVPTPDRHGGHGQRILIGIIAMVIGLAGVAVAVLVFGRVDEGATPAASKQRIVYSTVLFPDTPAQLYSMDPDGSNVVNLTNDDLSYFNAALSPDGSRLAFVRFDKEGNREEGIYVAGPDASGATAIYTSGETPQSILDLQWSPDGHELAFVLRTIPPGGGSEADFKQRLWLMEADGSDLHLVSEDQVTSFSWAPSGNGFAVTVQSPDGTRFVDDIFTMGLDGSTTGRLTSNGSSHDPMWAPDGQHIMFEGGWANAVRLMMMDSDGSDAHPVALDWDGWTEPLTWSPDSQAVLVSAGTDQHECATLRVNPTSGSYVTLLDGSTMLAVGDVSPGETPHATGDPCTQSAAWSGETATEGSAPVSASPALPNEGDSTVSAAPTATSGNYVFSDFEVAPSTAPGSGDVVPGSAEVISTQRWSTDAFPGEHQCRLTVFDASGHQIGTSDFGLMNLMSPNRGRMPVEVDGSIEGATATGSCDPTRLDAPLPYQTSVTDFTPADSGIDVEYRVTQPEVVPPWQQISHQACTVAAWAGDSVLASWHFTLGAPNGTYTTGIDMDQNLVPKVTEATVTCEPFSHDGTFPDPAL